MSDELVAADIKVGLVALTLDEAMARLHSTHRSPQGWDFDWRACIASTLCQNASTLLDGCELEMAAARVLRGEEATP